MAGVIATASAVNAQCNVKGFSGDFDAAGTPVKVSDLTAFSTGTVVASILSTVGVVNTSSLAQSSAFTGAAATDRPAQQGGVWVREVGGKVDSEASSSSATSALRTTSSSPAALQSLSGSQDCKLQTRTEYIGTQLGFDIARLRLDGGSNLTLGVTVGNTEVHSFDRTPGERTFGAQFQVPFAGLYGAYTKGPISLDAQVRWDAYRGIVSDFRVPSNNRALEQANQAVYHQRLDGHGVTLIANAAYRQDVPDSKLFIEPSLGIIASRTSMGDLSNSGNFFLPSQFGLTPPGRIQFEDIESFLGRVSLRVGTTVAAPGIILQPFVTGSVFHEFAGDAKALASGDFARLGPFAGAGTPRGTSTTPVVVGRVGTYGHVGLGLGGALLDSGWLGYVRADYRFGEYIDGWNFNVGARYQIASPTPTDATPGDDRRGSSAAPVSWSGPYIGMFAGGLFSHSDWNERAVPYAGGAALTPAGYPLGGGFIEPKASGFVGGGTLGYNHQFGRNVVGIEADWGLSNAAGSRACPGWTIIGEARDRSAFFDCIVSIEQLGFVTARYGQLWGDNTLLYLKGGLAIAQLDVRTRFLPLRNRRNIREEGERDFLTGWAIGAGVEYALSNRWSVKGEYMHFDLGSGSFLVDDGTSNDLQGLRPEVKTDGDVVRIGVNYRFGAN